MPVEDACVAKPRQAALWQRWTRPAVRRSAKRGHAGLLAAVLGGSVGTTEFLISDPIQKHACGIFAGFN